MQERNTMVNPRPGGEAYFNGVEATQL